VSLSGWQAGIQTDGVYGNARILSVDTARIRRELEAGKVVIVAGFQGISPEGDITTLGRGGSDTTAVALAAWLGADKCLIYTDVDGVYDKDPRKHGDAVRFDHIDYDRMLTLARGGAQVLHDRCVELAKKHGVAITVLSSFREGGGTVVGV
jgi:aspartate kinase